MLTAMGDTKDRIAGLETGVDDYLGKPFEPRELLLRIQNVLRATAPRRRRPASRSASSRSVPSSSTRSWASSPSKGKRVPLTDAEIALLRVFTARLGEVLSRETLCKSVGAGGQRARHRRAGDAAAPQDRARPVLPALSAHRPRPGLPAGRRMSAWVDT